MPSRSFYGNLTYSIFIQKQEATKEARRMSDRNRTVKMEYWDADGNTEHSKYAYRFVGVLNDWGKREGGGGGGGGRGGEKK